MSQRSSDPIFLKSRAQRNIQLAMKLERHCNFQDPRDIIYMQRARILYQEALRDLNAAINCPDGIEHKDKAARKNTEETMVLVEKSLRRFHEMAANYKFQMIKLDDGLQIHLRFLDRIAGLTNDDRYVCNCPKLTPEEMAAKCQPGPSTMPGNPTAQNHSENCKRERTEIMNLICDSYNTEVAEFRARSSVSAESDVELISDIGTGTCGSEVDPEEASDDKQEGGNARCERCGDAAEPDEESNNSN